jgi:hypothetical protein
MANRNKGNRGLFEGARKMKPTLKHRPAIWECMLATVYAMNDAGQTKYFDYDWDAAREFAGVDRPEADLRVYRAARSQGEIRKGQKVLYIKRA